MKRLTNLKMYVVGVFCIVAIASCEKEQEVIPEISNNTEGFMSKTGKSDTKIEENAEVVIPILHRSYSADISKEEADARFEEEVTEYMNKNSVNTNYEKGYSTRWYYRIRTKTGAQKNNETDGDAKASVRFRTSRGIYTHSVSSLNNAGDDRERGQTDYYYLSARYPGQAISWVEIQSGKISLKGTDGWFITNYDIYAYPSYQTVSATGSTYLRSYPNRWLDNTFFWGWDTYSAGERGTGRLNF
ncbi:hypothetical protein [Aquimarina macrocephali]|uniref:hypothetical protein n=1 Tax=Aquimarina macrocephali TaxID=666563 RepID=UPI0012693B38|nr:hypothetical protein [Aquimarina macrocephali]